MNRHHGAQILQALQGLGMRVVRTCQPPLCVVRHLAGDE
jgi:hypothetical protein